MNVTEAIEILRNTKLLCKDCWFHQGGFAGQMITEWICDRCGGKHRHHNTATPKICKDCAIKLNLCEYCGDKDHIFKDAPK